MKIRLDEALKICDKYGMEEVPIVFLSDLFLKAESGVKQFSQGAKFDPSYIDLFNQTDTQEIQVVFNERIFAKLVSNFPKNYRPPIARKNVVELDRIIDTLESANTLSKRKRCIVSTSEIYRKSASGNIETILAYGERLHHKRWNDLKTNLNRNAIIDYRYDEGGIIIFFLLNAGDPHYAQKFMKYTDIISMVVESKNAGVMISPDFNPEYDVYTVNEKSKLLEVYNDSRASLVIVAEDLAEEYKAALNQLKIFDRYARMMVIKNPDPAQKVDILNKIKLVYGQKIWEE